MFEGYYLFGGFVLELVLVIRSIPQGTLQKLLFWNRIGISFWGQGTTGEDI